MERARFMEETPGTMKYAWCSRWICGLALMVCAVGVARGEEYYVSSTLGDDANSGASPTEAWKTMTHALAAVPLPPAGGTHTIHVAAGRYDAALGEVFPLAIGPGLRLVGERAETRVDGAGAPVELFRIAADTVSQMTPVGPETLLDGFVITNAATGVHVSSDWVTCAPTLSRLEIRRMSTAGVGVTSASPWGAGLASPTLREVTVKNCFVGVLVRETTEFGQASARLEDCRLTGVKQAGVRVESAGSIADAALVRCRIEAGSGVGVSGYCTNRGSAALVLEDTLVANNVGHGVAILGQNAFGGSATIACVRSTICDNGGSGLRAEVYYSGGVLLSTSVIDGNGDDIDDVLAAGVFSTSYSNIGDGDFAGVNGNFSEPPGFANRSGDDFRLRFGSSCVDRGEPAYAVAVPDLEGVPRPLDGDLDTVLEVDVGAHELATLLQVGEALAGSTIELDLLGPDNGSCRLYYSPNGPALIPVKIPYGELWLPFPPRPSSAGAFSTANWPPVRVSIPVPAGSSLLAYQGLTTTTNHTLPWALTNPAVVPVAP